MLAKKILENLKNGNWRVEYREACDCGFYWHEKDDGVVCEVVNNDGCYYHNALIMDDLAGKFDKETIIDCDGVVAIYDNYYGVSLQFLCRNEAIVKQIQKFIWDDTDIWRDFIASINYPGNHSSLHEERKIKSLLEYVNWKMDNN